MILALSKKNWADRLLITDACGRYFFERLSWMGFYIHGGNDFTPEQAAP
jgi:hypothetical protein